MLLTFSAADIPAVAGNPVFGVDIADAIVFLVLLLLKTIMGNLVGRNVSLLEKLNLRTNS